MPGEMLYDQRIYRMLLRHKITLPITLWGHTIDEFRLYTHEENCDCYSCQIRPYLDEKEGEVWERLRLRIAKKGVFMMSWAAKKEFEQKLFDDYLWDIDMSGPGEYKKWEYAKDKGDTRNLTRMELDKLAKFIDGINKEHRLPTHAELDYINSVVTIPLPGSQPPADGPPPMMVVDDADEKERMNRLSEAEASRIALEGGDQEIIRTIAERRPRRATKVVSYAVDGSDDEKRKVSGKESSAKREYDDSAAGSSDWEQSSQDSDDEGASDLDTESDDGDAGSGDDCSDIAFDTAKKKRSTSCGARKPRSPSPKTGGAPRSGGGRLWTEDMIALLTKGVEKFKYDNGKPDWVRIAEYVSNGVDRVQCYRKWTKELDPSKKAMSGPWTAEEDAKLDQLVAQHTNAETKKFNWKTISEIMQRGYVECTNRYKNRIKCLRYAQMKKGPFTAEEDALILRRVKEWEGKKGIWSALEKEMNRRCTFIMDRWKKTLSKRQ